MIDSFSRLSISIPFYFLVCNNAGGCTGTGAICTDNQCECSDDGFILKEEGGTECVEGGKLNFQRRYHKLVVFLVFYPRFDKSKLNSYFTKINFTSNSKEQKKMKSWCMTFFLKGY